MTSTDDAAAKLEDTRPPLDDDAGSIDLYGDVAGYFFQVILSYPGCESSIVLCITYRSYPVLASCFACELSFCYFVKVNSNVVVPIPMSTPGENCSLVMTEHMELQLYDVQRLHETIQAH